MTTTFAPATARGIVTTGDLPEPAPATGVEDATTTQGRFDGVMRRLRSMAAAFRDVAAAGQLGPDAEVGAARWAGSRN